MFPRFEVELVPVNQRQDKDIVGEVGKEVDTAALAPNQLLDGVVGERVGGIIFDVVGKEEKIGGGDIQLVVVNAGIDVNVGGDAMVEGDI